MKQETLGSIQSTVVEGEIKEITRLTRQALKEGIPAEEILKDGIFAGLEIVGQKFQDNSFFVSDMLYASKVAKKGISLLKPYLESQCPGTHHRVIIGTVEGDLHDIGKDLVSTALRLNGFEVLDLGIDVSGESFLEALEKYPDTEIVCLSALLTATMPNMKKIVETLRRAYPDRGFRIMVGGAPLSEEFAESIGADAYTKNAMEAAAAARRLCRMADGE